MNPWPLDSVSSNSFFLPHWTLKKLWEKTFLLKYEGMEGHMYLCADKMATGHKTEPGTWNSVMKTAFQMISAIHWPLFTILCPFSTLRPCQGAIFPLCCKSFSKVTHYTCASCSGWIADSQKILLSSRLIHFPLPVNVISFREIVFADVAHKKICVCGGVSREN